MHADEYGHVADSTSKIVVLFPFDQDATIDVPRVVEQLLAEFPGSRITAENSFEAESAKVKNAQKRIFEQDEQVKRGIELVLGSIDRKEKATGPGTDVSICVTGDHRFSGYVRAKSVRFSADARLPDESVAQFVAFLESLNIGSVMTKKLDK